MSLWKGGDRMNINSGNLTMFATLLSCIAIFLHNSISNLADILIFTASVAILLFSLVVNVLSIDGSLEEGNGAEIKIQNYYQFIAYAIVGIASIIIYLLRDKNNSDFEKLLGLPIVSFFMLLMAYKIDKVYKVSKTFVTSIKGTRDNLSSILQQRCLRAITANFVMIYILIVMLVPDNFFQITLVALLIWVFFPLLYWRIMSMRADD